MPQPIHKPGMAYRASPQHLLERPKLAALIGTIAAEWGYIDRSLITLFERANSSTPYKDEVAVTVFDALSNLSLRLDLMEKILKLRVSADLVCEFQGLRIEIGKRSRERNMVVHASWSITDDLPDDLVSIDNVTGVATRYTEHDLKQTLDRITMVRNKLNDYVVRVANAPKCSS